MLQSVWNVAWPFLVVTILGMLLAGLWKGVKALFAMDKKLESLIVSNNVQAQESRTVYIVMKHVIDADKNICAAMKKLGANGEITMALGDLQKAEDTYSKQLIENIGGC